MPIQNPFNSHFSQPPSHTEAPKKSGNLRSRIFKNKLILGGLGLFLLAGGLVSALYLSKSSQDIRQQATGDATICTYTEWTTSNDCTGDHSSYINTNKGITDIEDTCYRDVDPYGGREYSYKYTNCSTQATTPTPTATATATTTPTPYTAPITTDMYGVKNKGSNPLSVAGPIVIGQPNTYILNGGIRIPPGTITIDFGVYFFNPSMGNTYAAFSVFSNKPIDNSMTSSFSFNNTINDNELNRLFINKPETVASILITYRNSTGQIIATCDDYPDWPSIRTRWRAYCSGDDGLFDRLPVTILEEAPADPNALNCNSMTVSNSCPEPNTNITITQSATNANRYRIGWRWENGIFSSFTQGLATQTFRVPDQEGNLQLASNVCSTSNAEVCTYDGKLYEANYLCDPITSSSLGTCSGCSTWITACKKPTRPTNTQFSFNFGDPSINAASAMRFSWDASANADGYRIYRTVTIDGQAQERLMGTTTSTQLMIVGRDTSLCTNFEASTCRIEAYRTCGGYCNNLEKTIDSINFICTCSQAYATAAPTPTLTPAPTLAMTLTDKPLQGPQCASIQMYLNNDMVLNNQLNSIPVGSTVKFKCSSNIFIPVVDSYKFRVIYNSQITELLPIATDPHFSENYQIPANQAGNYSAQCTVCRDDQCQAWEAF